MTDLPASSAGSATGVSEPATRATEKPMRERLVRLADHFKREWQIYVMLAPMIIWFLLFLYKPMYGLQIAFKDYSIFRGIVESPWVGWHG